MPYFIINTNKFPDDEFLITPICLSGPDIESISILDNISDLNISGGFIQTRYASNDSNCFIQTNQFIAFKDRRYNYRIDLRISDSDYIKKMKPDARQRIKKLLKNFGSDTELCKTNSAKDIQTFASIYEDTAERVNFSLAYRFDKKDWEVLLSDEAWSLYLLKFKNEVISGCIVSRQRNNNYDFTFMAHKKDFNDAPRLLIFYLRNYLSGVFKDGFLDLGGGISENDSLANFKNRLGSDKVGFERIRFISKTFIEKYKLEENQIQSYLGNIWP